MAFKFDETTIPASGTIEFNGTIIKELIFNGVTVWTKESTQTGTYYHFYRCGSEDGGYGTISITFDTAFSSVPTVSLTFENKKYCNYRVQSTTTTGFKIRWDQTTGNSKYIEKCYIHWTAVGEV